MNLKVLTIAALYITVSNVLGFRNLLKIRSKWELNSFGDPDRSIRYENLRKWQEFCRWYDNLIYPEESDFPGLNYVSPIEWAPWMETVWFGNFYDYRSAYFHDVMYSNQKPNREGALLFPDPQQSIKVALLYQRYKKFDESSYSLSNATFFNIFGSEALRLGRYKVPLNNEVILCITDPLTFSDLKRYLNSFNVLKWFKSKFMQQKRKRQYILQIMKKASKGKSYLDDFFGNAVHKLEYAKNLENPLIQQKFKNKVSFQIPIIPSRIMIDNARIIESSKFTTISFPLLYANAQYAMESLAQSVHDFIVQKLSATNSVRLVMGGDGRLLNDYASEIFIRVFSANGFPKIFIAEQNVISCSSAQALLDSSTPWGQDDNGSDMDVALVFSPGPQPAGLKGYWGLSMLVRKQDETRSISKDEWREVVSNASQLDQVGIAISRPPEAVLHQLAVGENKDMKSNNPIYFEKTPISRLNVAANYQKFLREVVDFEKVKKFIKDFDLYITIDGMNGIAGQFLSPSLLTELGFDFNNFLNCAHQDDFGQRVWPISKDMDVNSTEGWSDLYVNCTDSAILFNTATSIAEGRSTGLEDCPDLGFILSPDLSHCTVKSI